MLSSSFFESAHFQDGKYKNQHPPEKDLSFYKLMFGFLREHRDIWPYPIENVSTPEFRTAADKADEVVVTFINHATFLIQAKNLTIITDPVFAKRVGPFGVGPKRHRDPGASIRELPPIDMITVSHNHYDHMDIKALRTLQKKHDCPIVVSMGNKRFLEKKGLKNVTELNWGDQYVDQARSFSVTATPAQHGSGRSIFDQNDTLWCGYVYSLPEAKIYHAGDSGYNTHYKDIGSEFDIDISFLPIGAYKPGFLLKYVHQDPFDAAQAHIDLGSTISFPMHYDTFSLAAEGYQETIDEFEQALKKTSLTEEKFKKLHVGQSVRVPVNRPNPL